MCSHFPSFFPEFPLKLGVIVVVISNQPHATRLAKLKHLANYTLYSIHFLTTCDPCNPFGSPQCTFLQIASFYGISFSQLHWNMTTNQISRLVDRNQSNCRKWDTNFATFINQVKNTGSKNYLYKKLKKPCIDRLYFSLFDWNNTCDFSQTRVSS